MAVRRRRNYSDGWQIRSVLAKAKMERWRARARLLVPRRLGMPVGLSDQKVSLTLAELRTVDPTIAEDIYSGWVVLADRLEAAGITPHVIGGADLAAELDAKRAIDQGVRLAVSFGS